MPLIDMNPRPRKAPSPFRRLLQAVVRRLRSGRTLAGAQQPFSQRQPARSDQGLPRHARRALRRWVGGALLAVVALVAVVLLKPFSPTIQAHVAPLPPPPPLVKKELLKGDIQPGETFSGLLNPYFGSQELAAIITEARQVFPLTSIRAGNPYLIHLSDGRLERFEYDISNEEQLVLERGTDGTSVSRVLIPFTSEVTVIHGNISSSLYEAVAETGETDALAEELADIFAYDVDFIRDIRTGDSFSVLVEKQLRAGRPPGYGPIQAATFTNQGETFTAFRFQDGKHAPSYYDAEGKALRKAFLKAPLSFSRISSGFSLNRFHPIAKTWRAHPAIDYAAPTGTPIKTVGDGSISKIGRTAGNGNYIKIRHANGYETLYLHMSRFAKGMSQGKRVAQGQVIGYVGSTGLATGPHLCFRMVKNGAPVNPAKIKAASANPVSRDHLAAFKELTAPLLARLEGSPPSQLQAKLTPSPSPEGAPR